ncbi:MAG: hypothetical protein M2R45_01677 [Verrucomicrobia subdivision 3 bacterium]|nr:hypothetical protein [Limisphaerales bacterium]
MNLLGAFVHLLILQERIHPLDGADADLAILGDKGRSKALDVVEFRELAVVVAGHIGHELLLGLLAQIPGVHQEQDAFGAGVFEQPVDRGDGSVGLARAGCHLNERARAVVLEGRFQVPDSVDLAGSQPCGIQGWQILKPSAKGNRLAEPLLHRLWPMEAEYLP